MTRNKFLSAEWRKLIMANYAVDPAVLLPFLPAKTELDYFRGSCFVSLVGFLFKDVKLKGMRIPGHVNFPEVNLRFYVKHFDTVQNKWKRGVVFISEIVPKPAISFVANTLYNESYTTLPMRYSWETKDGELTVQYGWKKNKKWNSLELIAETTATALEAGSQEEFITEHFWGYSTRRKGVTVEYPVEHPRWEIYKVKQYKIDCRFEELYGPAFSFLQTEHPVSVFMAEGSPVAIYAKRIL